MLESLSKKSDCLFLIKILHKSLRFRHSVSYEAAIDAGAPSPSAFRLKDRIPFTSFFWGQGD